MRWLVMNSFDQRDYITVEDEDGIEKQFAVEALFNMENKNYAFLRSVNNKNDLFVMAVEDDEDGQVLTKIKDQQKREMVLDAYQIAVQCNPAE
ncbi:hypothetical protein B1NLA3E_09950 [Bacillus sp. 1NLA3E]|nr:hypothetical protein B1NLA3E_09950 [Bacillus sp. 1NLA3E]